MFLPKSLCSFYPYSCSACLNPVGKHSLHSSLLALKHRRKPCFSDIKNSNSKPADYTGRAHLAWVGLVLSAGLELKIKQRAEGCARFAHDVKACWQAKWLASCSPSTLCIEVVFVFHCNKVGKEVHVGIAYGIGETFSLLGRRQCW